MDERERQPNSYGISPIWKWGIVIIAIVMVIIVVIVIALYAGGSLGTSRYEASTMWMGYGSQQDSGGQRFSFEHVQQLKRKELKSASLKNLKELCKNYKKKLAVPRTDFDLNQILDTIKQYHEDAECPYYALGLQLNPSERYASIDKKKKHKWPPVSANTTNPGIPIDAENRDCLLVDSTDPENIVTEEKKCADIKSFKCILVQDCDKEHKCLKSATVSSKNISEAWNAAKKDTITNVALLDKDYIIDELKELSVKDCYALAVKYILDYVDIYTLSKTRVIKIDAHQHPELACVNVNGATLALSRVDCDMVGCPICF